MDECYLMGLWCGLIMFKFLEEYYQFWSTGPTPVQTSTHVVLPANDDNESIVVETRDVSPAHFETRIKSFSLLSSIGIDKYETREFEAGDYKWRLVIYPGGKEKGDYISVYLSLVDTNSLPLDWEFNATCTVFLYDHILDKYLCFRVNERNFNKTTTEWGFPKFIPKKVLIDQSSRYIADDSIVLGAEILVIKRHRVIETVTLLKTTEVPQKYEWKIQEFSKLEEDRVRISEEFTIRDVNWRMKLYLNGDSSELSMDVVCASADTFDAHQKVKAEFYLRLKGRLGVVRSSGKLSHWFTSLDKCCGQKAFISFSTMRDPENGLLVDDCCTLQVEILVQLVV
ncbi:hypothetical protein ABFX02_12G097700 [Erythranthe guttata]